MEWADYVIEKLDLLEDEVWYLEGRIDFPYGIHHSALKRVCVTTVCEI